MFQDKHVFFVNIEDNFIYLNVDALIYRAGVEPSKIIDIDACVCDKTYILITDDEVERWGRCVDVHDHLKRLRLQVK